MYFVGWMTNTPTTHEMEGTLETWYLGQLIMPWNSCNYLSRFRFNSLNKNTPSHQSGKPVISRQNPEQSSKERPCSSHMACSVADSLYSFQKAEQWEPKQSLSLVSFLLGALWVLVAIWSQSHWACSPAINSDSGSLCQCRVLDGLPAVFLVTPYPCLWSCR